MILFVDQIQGVTREKKYPVPIQEQQANKPPGRHGEIREREHFIPPPGGGNLPGPADQR